MRLITWILLIVLGGCASGPLPQVRPQTAFAPGDYEWSLAKGDNRITGSLWTILPNGQKSVCQQVIMSPAGRYIDELMQFRFGSTIKGYKRRIGRGQQSPYVVEDYRSQHFSRKLPCDSDGGFSAAELPDGSYYLWGVISWATPSWDWSKPDDYEAFMQRVDLRGGEAVHVDLHP